MGIDYAAAEDIPPETEQQARKGEAAMSSTAATDNESLKISGEEAVMRNAQLMKSSKNRKMTSRKSGKL